MIRRAKCISSWWFLNENFFVIISYIKKKLKIGNSKVIEIIKIWKFVSKIFDKLSVGINPPEEIIVKAKWKESRSLILTKLNKKIIKIVEKK